MKDNSAKFEEAFAVEEREMIFLTGEVVGFMWQITNDCRQRGAVYLGVSDIVSEKTAAERGHIFFQCESGEIKPLTKYRVKCRAIKDKTLPSDMSSLSINDFLVTEISEEDAADPRLDEILCKYREEAVYEDEDFGTFYLDCSVNMYIGSVDLFGHKCELALEYDEEDSSAVKDALIQFKKNYENRDNWDKKLRIYAATELKNKYGDKLNMSLEEISENIRAERISAYSYGGFNVEFGDNGLFKGSGIEVLTDENGNPEAIEIDEQ